MSINRVFTSIYTHFTYHDMEKYAKKNKSPHGLSRPEAAFLGKARKIKGCGSLKRDFYTGFIPKIKDLGLWHG